MQMTYYNILGDFFICKGSNTICFTLTPPEEFRVVKFFTRLIMYEWMNYLLCMQLVACQQKTYTVFLYHIPKRMSNKRQRQI